MNRRLFLPLAIAASISAGFTLSQDPADDKVQALTDELAATRAELKELSETVANHERVLGDTVTYLTTQASAAGDVAGALSEAEDAGFTAGINPRSREILLEAWRSQAAGAKKDVPVLEQAPAEEPTGRTARRSRRGGS